MPIEFLLLLFCCLRNADCPVKHGCMRTNTLIAANHTSAAPLVPVLAPSASDFLAPVAEGQTRHHGQCLGRAGKKVILGFKVRKVQILPTARTSKNFTLEKSRRRKREKLTLHPPMSLENPISQSGTLRSKGLQLPGFYLRSLPSRGMTILTSGWFFSRLFQEQFLLDLNFQFDFDYIVIGSMIS